MVGLTIFWSKKLMITKRTDQVLDLLHMLLLLPTHYVTLTNINLTLSSSIQSIVKLNSYYLSMALPIIQTGKLFH